jgi:hypothetical protein
MPGTPPPTERPRESPSTLLNHGSASFTASGGFDNAYALFFSPFYSRAWTNIHRRSAVEPWIARDMQKQQFVEVEDLVGAFLSRLWVIPLSPKQTTQKFTMPERYLVYVVG